MKEKSERVLYLDAIRGAATIAVIILHIATQNFYINPHEPAWNIFNLIDSGVRWGVPVFVMISGALFLEKDISIKDILIYSARLDQPSRPIRSSDMMK